MNAEQGGRTRRPRVRVLDALRGFSVLSMIVYHALFNIVWLFGHTAGMGWYMGLPGYLWQQSICWAFIWVAGASLHYSTHLLRHALVVLGGAAVVTLVSLIVMPLQPIWFGILHLLGFSILLFVPLKKAMEKVPLWLGALLCMALFLFTKGLPYGFVGLADWPLLEVPGAWYQTSWLFWLGLPSDRFFAGDYFPLIPWLFLFWAGYFVWGMIKPYVRPGAPGRNPLEWAGHHSLMIYLLHQPVLLGVCLLLNFMDVL